MNDFYNYIDYIYTNKYMNVVASATNSSRTSNSTSVVKNI